MKISRWISYEYLQTTKKLNKTDELQFIPYCQKLLWEEKVIRIKSDFAIFLPVTISDNKVVWGGVSSPIKDM